MLRYFFREKICRPPVKRAVDNLLRERKVLSGPFVGMSYIDRAVGSSWFPKLLGTYEMELAPVIEKLPAMGFDRVVDVGAAEGYYAVGLARMLNLPVTAFEAGNREPLENLVKLNGVEDRVTIRDYCDLGRLQDAIGDGAGTLLVMDIEGGEVSMLDPEFLPALKHCAILVETHDFIIRGANDAVAARFASTHDVEAIPYRRRTAEDFPASIGPFRLFDHRQYLLEYMDERLPGTAWLWMTPKEK